MPIKRIEKEDDKRGDRMTLKLVFLFIIMDFLTLIAYPIILISGWIRQLLKLQEPQL